jgi:uncharacterized protein with beta-barrel porin domain
MEEPRESGAPFIFVFGALPSRKNGRSFQTGTQYVSAARRPVVMDSRGATRGGERETDGQTSPNTPLGVVTGGNTR